MSDDVNPRRRMVVEEVGVEVNDAEIKEEEKVEKVEEVATMTPAEAVKEKVEELQDITNHIAEDVKESSEVQKEIVEAVEKQEEFIAPKQVSDFNPLIVVIPGVLLLGALVGGIVFYQKSMNKVSEEPTPTPAEEALVISEPTATPASTKTSLTKYSISVKNGSGIAGEAGRAQTLVETAGFKVGGTGNADSYTYTKTIIKAKASVEKDYLDALTTALSKNYTLDKNATLSATSTDDVQIIVGSLKSAN